MIAGHEITQRLFHHGVGLGDGHFVVFVDFSPMGPWSVLVDEPVDLLFDLVPLVHFAVGHDNGVVEGRTIGIRGVLVEQ